MKKMRLFRELAMVALLLQSTLMVDAQYFSKSKVVSNQTATDSIKIGRNAIDVGDFDADGDMDMLIIGEFQADKRTNAYILKNDGTGAFSVVADTLNSTNSICDSLKGLLNGTANWFDYDKDGKLDFLITGSKAGVNDKTNDKVAWLFHQETGGKFKKVPAPLFRPAKADTTFKWRTIKTGTTNVIDSTIILKRPARPDTSLIGVTSSSVLILDYNNDGYQDILISGLPAKYQAMGGADLKIITLYKNTKDPLHPFEDADIDFGTESRYAAQNPYKPYTSFDSTKTYKNVGASKSSSVATICGFMSFIDINKDNKKDLITYGYPNLVSVATCDDNGKFSNQRYSSSLSASLDGLVPARQASGVWGDFDKNGTMDLVMSYNDISKTPVPSIKLFSGRTDSVGKFKTHKVFGVDSFSSAHDSKVKFREQSITSGDYDGDGDLDILVIGAKGIGADVRMPLATLYRNDSRTAYKDSFRFTNVTEFEFPDGLDGFISGTAIMKDFDKDGDLDILVSGASSPNALHTGYLKIYTNEKPATIKVTNITITSKGNATSVAPASTLQLYATADPQYAKDTTIVWSVDKTTIASIDTKGALTGKSLGTVVVTAKANDGSGAIAKKSIIVGQTGVSENTIAKLNVSPNPVSNILIIGNTQKVSKVEILDIQGSVILTANSAQINVSILKSGIYIVRANVDNKTLIAKIVKK